MKYKRLKLSLLALIINFILFIVGMYMGSDLSALGIGLSLINAPIYGYIMGDTLRASKKE